MENKQKKIFRFNSLFIVPGLVMMYWTLKTDWFTLNFILSCIVLLFGIINFILLLKNKKFN